MNQGYLQISLFQSVKGITSFLFQLALLWGFVAASEPHVPYYRFCIWKHALFWFWHYVQLPPIIFKQQISTFPQQTVSQANLEKL